MDGSGRNGWINMGARMTQSDEMADALRPLLKVFADLRIEYRIGGSVASSTFGRARSTMDVDLVVNLGREHVEPLCSALGTDYYIDAGAMREAIGRQSSFNLIHLATMIKVDVFVLGTGPYDRESFSRSSKEAIGTLSDVSFCTAEDMILRKLEWYHAGGELSDRQWVDVLGLLQVQAGALDQDYLTRWARELGLSDLLDRAQEKARQ